MVYVLNGLSGFFGEDKVVDSLERYFSVLKDNLPAKFRICKKVPVDEDFCSKESELWEVHDSSMGRFRKLVKEIDNGNVRLEEIEKTESSLLDLKIELADRILSSCHFCEHLCGIDRFEKGEIGFCGVGKTSKIASDFIHRGEEPELVPSYTIFFSGCTFKCQYCQNWDISQSPKRGVEFTPERILSYIEEKAKGGARNVNWVGGDPTPNLHNILRALKKCNSNIPSVWNSNMYFSKEGMKLLSGTQDIYLTDFKYGNNECAIKYSKVPNYWEAVTRNHRLAFEDAELIIRHLVLPGHLDCCTKKILDWIKENLSSKVRINLMDQYRPVAKAWRYPEISRRISGEEWNQAIKMAKEKGLKNVIW